MRSRVHEVSLASAVVLAASASLVFALSSLEACNLKANSDGCAALTSNSGDGVTTCGTATCSATTYCSNPSGNVCGNGCKADENCPDNQTCDLSSAQTDLGGNKVGNCTVKRLSEQSSPCGEGGTPDVDGGDSGMAAPKDAGRD